MFNDKNMKYAYDMTEAEAKGAVETFRHKMKVFNILSIFCQKILDRAVDHDNSKLTGGELIAFGKGTEQLMKVSYGSDEYKEILASMGPAIKEHQIFNRHHPEHFAHGVSDMNLIDLIEMLTDWKAASERVKDGHILKSIELNAERFVIDPQLKEIMINTCHDLGWISNEEISIYLDKAKEKINANK